MFFARTVSGYVYDTPQHARWPGLTIPVIVKLGAPTRVLRDGSLSFNQSIENAMTLWNQQIGNARFTWTEAVRDRPAASDGITTISFESDLYGKAFGRNTLAVTMVTNSGAQMIEADILFNKAWPFDSFFGPLPTNSNLEDLHRVGLHELGHVLGLDHPDDAGQRVAAIMNANTSDLDRLTADDAAGAQSLYGAPPNAPPLARRGQIANISTRVRVGTGVDVMIGGFITRDASKQLLIRALGPSLPLAGALADPVLELHNGSGDLIATNDNWKDTQQQAIEDSTLAPPNERESALLATLPAGAYTAVVSGNDSTSGQGLVEVYDLSPGTGRLANIATRGHVGTGDEVMIGGFIVRGPESKPVIVRGIGPSLKPGIANALSDTLLEVRNANGFLMTSNSGWRTSADGGDAVSASGFAPSSDAESACLAEVMPGSYTAILKSPSNSDGVGLIEVYDLLP